jgi:hypothetical protein
VEQYLILAFEDLFRLGKFSLGQFQFVKGKDSDSQYCFAIAFSSTLGYLAFNCKHPSISTKYTGVTSALSRVAILMTLETPKQFLCPWSKESI